MEIIGVNVDKYVIINIVSRFFRIDKNILFENNKRSSQQTYTPKAICWYLLYTKTNMTYPEIAKMFNRHHATIIHGVRTTEKHYLRFITRIVRMLSEQHEKAFYGCCI